MSFCVRKVSRNTFRSDKDTYPINFTLLLSYRQLGVNVLNIVNALNYFTLVCNVTSVLVEMVNSAMVKVDNFCKNKLTACSSKFLMETTQRLLFLKKNDKRICLFGCSIVKLN